MPSRLKEQLRQNHLVRVFCLGQLCSPKLVEMIAWGGGYDAIWLDQEHGGLTMPQLEVSTFVPQLFWLAVTFVLLLLLMAKIGLPRVGGLIEARRRRIDEDLERAAQLKTEAEAVLAAYQETLARARSEAQAAVKDETDRMAAQAAERQRQLSESLVRVPSCV